MKDKRIYVSQAETEAVENRLPEVIEAALEEDLPTCELPEPRLGDEEVGLREPGPPAAVESEEARHRNPRTSPARPAPRAS